jgi:hypothetical protein
MIIQRPRSMWTSPTALSGAGAEALFDSFGGFGSDDLPTVSLNYAKWMQESGELLDQWEVLLQRLFAFVNNPPWGSDKNSIQAIKGLANKQLTYWSNLTATREKACEDAVTYKKWLGSLRLYVDEAAFLVDLQTEQGYWNNLSAAATKTYEDVVVLAEKAITPSAWPTWLKVTAGVAAVAGVAYVLNSFTGAVRAVRGR